MLYMWEGVFGLDGHLVERWEERLDRVPPGGFGDIGDIGGSPA